MYFYIHSLPRLQTSSPFTKNLRETHPDQPGRKGGLQIQLLPFVLQLPSHSCPAVQAEPCRATCANATLDMNYNSFFLMPKHEKVLRHNPLKTSEISKLLKSNKSLKEKLSFHLKTYQKQQSPKIGGARRDRTADLLRARQALSQLSYGPFASSFSAWLCCDVRSVACVFVYTLAPSLTPRLASHKNICANVRSPLNPL